MHVHTRTLATCRCILVIIIVVAFSWPLYNKQTLHLQTIFRVHGHVHVRLHDIPVLLTKPVIAFSNTAVVQHAYDMCSVQN